MWSCHHGNAKQSVHGSDWTVSCPVLSRVQIHNGYASLWFQCHFGNTIKSVTDQGFTIKHHILDNEAPPLLLDLLNEKHIQYQLVPPHMHWRNAVERAIRTFKNHLIAGLSSLPPTFPMNLWCKLLPQALITINLLQQSRTLPHLSAFSHFQGHFDYNATPLAPPGSHVLVHEKNNYEAIMGTSWHGRLLLGTSNETLPLLHDVYHIYSCNLYFWFRHFSPHFETAYFISVEYTSWFRRNHRNCAS